MSLIRKHGAVLQAWACLDLVFTSTGNVCCVQCNRNACRNRFA